MMPRNYIEILKMQSEVEELKNRIKDFEERYKEIEKENQERLKEAEEAQLKATQLQETIERLLKKLLASNLYLSLSLYYHKIACIEYRFFVTTD